MLRKILEFQAMKVWVASKLWFQSYHLSKIYLLNRVLCYQRFWMELTVQQNKNMTAAREKKLLQVMPLYWICFMVYLYICMFLGTGSSIFSIRYIFSSLIKGLGNKIFLSRISLNNFLKYNFSFENQGCMQCKKGMFVCL